MDGQTGLSRTRGSAGSNVNPEEVVKDKPKGAEAEGKDRRGCKAKSKIK